MLFKQRNSFFKNHKRLIDDLIVVGREQIEKVQCPVCRIFRTDPLDIEAIRKIGECLSCDHIRTDLIR